MTETQLVARLTGTTLPDVTLNATDGTSVALAHLVGISVIYAYPRTSPPNAAPIPGWDDIAGTRGCTPQSCGFRDHHAALQALGVTRVFGLSTQSTAYQQEMVKRLHLPFSVLSDADFALRDALNLPYFEAAGFTLLKRFTLIVEGNRIKQVLYPVADPAAQAAHIEAALTKA